jgi:hypothetical protein
VSDHVSKAQPTPRYGAFFPIQAPSTPSRPPATPAATTSHSQTPCRQPPIRPPTGLMTPSLRRPPPPSSSSSVLLSMPSARRIPPPPSSRPGVLLGTPARRRARTLEVLVRPSKEEDEEDEVPGPERVEGSSPLGRSSTRRFLPPASAPSSERE